MRVERSSGAAPPRQPGRSGSDRPLLEIHIEDTPGGIATVALAGELDLSTAPRMKSPLLEQIAQRAGVLVDLSELTFIDSSGIGSLIQLWRGANGTPVCVLIGAGSHVERIFQIAGIGDALPVYADRDAALAALTADETARPSD